jgi:Flp pilus assembly protein TadG
MSPARPAKDATVLQRCGGGQGLAEFALVAPIILLLLFGVIQLGLLMAAQNGLVNGVRDAARRAATYRINEASLDPTSFTAICDSIAAQLTTSLRDGIPGYESAQMARTITYEWNQDPNAADYFLVAHITASYKNPLYVPLVSQFLDGADGSNDNRLRLSASEQMRIENPTLTAPVVYTTGRTC